MKIYNDLFMYKKTYIVICMVVSNSFDSSKACIQIIIQFVFFFYKQSIY